MVDSLWWVALVKLIGARAIGFRSLCGMWFYLARPGERRSCFSEFSAMSAGLRGSVYEGST